MRERNEEKKNVSRSNIRGCGNCGKPFRRRIAVRIRLCRDPCGKACGRLWTDVENFSRRRVGPVTAGPEKRSQAGFARDSTWGVGSLLHIPFSGKRKLPCLFHRGRVRQTGRFPQTEGGGGTLLYRMSAHPGKGLRRTDFHRKRQFSRGFSTEFSTSVEKLWVICGKNGRDPPAERRSLIGRSFSIRACARGDMEKFEQTLKFSS